MAEFAHLHLHTQYSLLDGAIHTKDLFPRVRELGMDTVAVTDHGNMFGAIDLYSESKKLFGCETYFAATDRTERTNRRTYHLVLRRTALSAHRDRASVVCLPRGHACP